MLFLLKSSVPAAGAGLVFLVVALASPGAVRAAVPPPAPPPPAPVVTPTATASTSTSAATRALLAEINAARAAHHRAPLVLDKQESRCSRAHSKHMALEGGISHDQFPRDICVQFAHTAGENVGEATGDLLSAVQQIDQMMLAEGPCPDRGCPGDEFTQHGHYLNLLNSHYTHIGIGLYAAAGTVWLTEDFTG